MISTIVTAVATALFLVASWRNVQTLSLSWKIHMFARRLERETFDDTPTEARP